jgi:hypothetical protein
MDVCPCGSPTCVEPWEPGCDLGLSDSCQRVSPEEEALINAIVAAHLAGIDTVGG